MRELTMALLKEKVHGFHGLQVGGGCHGQNLCKIDAYKILA